MGFTELILRLHSAGKRNYEIAELVGCAANTVSATLSARGLEANVVVRTHCSQGHAWTAENTYRTKRGHKSCRTCHRLKNREANGWKERPDRSEFRHDFFDSFTPTSAYVAGFIAADGYIKSGSDRVWSVAQTGDDGAHQLRWIAALLGHRPPITSKMTMSGRIGWTLNVSSRQQVTALRELYGILPRKSLTLQWPASLPDNVHAAFCRGYWDGDGSVFVHDRGSRRSLIVSVCSGSSDFLLGMRACLPIEPPTLRFREHPTRLVSLVTVGERAYRLGNWLFADGELFRSRKARVLDAYLDEDTPPKWLRRIRRQPELPLEDAA